MVRNKWSSKSRSLCAVMLALTAFCGTLSAATGSPYDDRAATLAPVANFIIKRNPAAGLDYNLDVTLPKVAGSYPVFLFLTGLNGVAPSGAYHKMAAKLAARGVATVIPQVVMALPDHFTQVGLSFTRVASWMTQNMNATLKMQSGLPAGVAIDPAKLVVSGHSAGAKGIMTMYRQMHDKIAGVVLLDPVDSDPMHSTKSSFEQDELFAFGTPLLVLGSGLGDQPGINLGHIWPACAPLGSSAEFFFDHFHSPKWLVKFMDYGHADMLEGVYLWAMQSSHFCKSAVYQRDPDVLRTFIAGAVSSFIRATIDKDSTMLDYIELPERINLRTETLADP